MTAAAQPVPLRFDHVALQVPEIAAAVRWYVEVLPGARVLYQDETWAFVEACGTKLAFVLKDQHPGHLAWRVSDADLERLATRFGQPIKPHRDRTRSFYLQGPGGYWLEIISFPDDYAFK